MHSTLQEVLRIIEGVGPCLWYVMAVLLTPNCLTVETKCSSFCKSSLS